MKEHPKTAASATRLYFLIPWQTDYLVHVVLSLCHSYPNPHDRKGRTRDQWSNSQGNQQMSTPPLYPPTFLGLSAGTTAVAPSPDLIANPARDAAAPDLGPTPHAASRGRAVAPPVPPGTAATGAATAPAVCTVAATADIGAMASFLSLIRPRARPPFLFGVLQRLVPAPRSLRGRF